MFYVNVLQKRKFPDPYQRGIFGKFVPLNSIILQITFDSIRVLSDPANAGSHGSLSGGSLSFDIY